MRTFEEDLQAAVAAHGHLCAGQVLGVRLARCGLRILGIEDPAHYRDLVTFVESDRCLGDAVSTVSACRLGRRRLKYMDYGKSAASFLDLASGKAVRVATRFWANPPAGVDIVEYFSQKTDDELFICQPVSISLSPYDMPGKPLEKVNCARCGEIVTDHRQVERGGQILCRACAGPAYYELSC